MQRLHQSVLCLSMLVLSWLGMMVVHECGHVVGAWLTGGQVAKVVLHPLTISRTDLVSNPRPLVVAWAGPLLGVLLPLAAWGLAVAAGWSQAYLARFFAGFCLVANGAYIGVGSWARIGDSAEMLRHGSAIWPLWLFGLVSVPLGLWLWNGLGTHFGLGTARAAVNPRAAYGCLLAAVVLVAFCSLLS